MSRTWHRNYREAVDAHDASPPDDLAGAADVYEAHPCFVGDAIDVLNDTAPPDLPSTLTTAIVAWYRTTAAYADRVDEVTRAGKYIP